MPLQSLASFGSRRRKLVNSSVIPESSSERDKNGRAVASSAAVELKPLRGKGIKAGADLQQPVRDVQPEDLYFPLNSSRAEFRLIQIDATSKEDHIRCHLQVFSLATSAPDPPKWQALSYEWGKDPAQDDIEVDGRTFPVRPNLHRFLQQMAREKHADWMYIDAICINQTDIAEREQQVALMHDIYRRAEEVILWIYNPDLKAEWYQRTFDDLERLRRQLPMYRMNLRAADRMLEKHDKSARFSVQLPRTPFRWLEDRRAASRREDEKEREEIQTARDLIKDGITNIEPHLSRYDLARSLVDEAIAKHSGGRAGPMFRSDYNRQVAQCIGELECGRSAAEIKSELIPDRSWNILSYFAYRASYWSRLWIVQEVLLARRLTIRLGLERVDPVDLYTNLQTAFPFLAQLDSYCGDLEKVFNIDHVWTGIPLQGDFFDANQCAHILGLSYRSRQMGSGAIRLPFFHAVDYFSTQDCTQFHDRVYGLLALTRSQIPINYRISRVRLFAFLWAEYLLSWGLLVSGDIIEKAGEDVAVENEAEAEAEAEAAAKQADGDPDANPIHFSRFLVNTAAGQEIGKRGIVPFMALRLPCMDPVIFLVAWAIAIALCDGGANSPAMLTLAKSFMEAISYTNSVKNDSHEKIVPVDVLADALMRQAKGAGEAAGSMGPRPSRWDTPEALEMFKSEDIVWRGKSAALFQLLKAAAATDELLTFDGVNDDGQETGETRRYSEWVQLATSAAGEVWDRYAQFTVDDSEGMVGNDDEWILIA